MNDFDHYLDTAVVNVADIFPRATCVGPGARAILWVQGCVNNCPGCITPEMKTFDIQRMVKVDVLAALLLGIPKIEGITVVGGEPALQFRSLGVLFHCLRQAGLSVMVYTGYRIEKLRRVSRLGMDAFLDSIDILVDGPYVASLDKDQMWRGSGNQRIHFLTDRYRDYVWVHSTLDRTQELIYNAQGRYVYVGIPPSRIQE